MSAFTQNAVALKDEIAAALSLYGDDKQGIYVSGSDSNNSRPTAWVSMKDSGLDGGKIAKLMAIGWKVGIISAEKKGTIKIVMWFTEESA